MKFDSLQSTINWNLKAGNKKKLYGSEAYWQSLKAQALCLKEEALELLEAIENRDPVETLDAQADIQYVLNGLIFLSQHDHEGAMKAVCDNNDLKVSTDEKEIVERVQDYSSIGIGDLQIRTTQFEDEFYHAIVRTTDGKIMKGLNHPQVDLVPFVHSPVQLRKSFVIVTKPNCTVCETIKQDLQILESTITEDRDEETLLKVGDIHVIVFDHTDKIILQDTVSYQKLGYSIKQLQHWIAGVEGKAKKIILEGLI